MNPVTEEQPSSVEMPCFVNEQMKELFLAFIQNQMGNISSSQVEFGGEGEMAAPYIQPPGLGNEQDSEYFQHFLMDSCYSSYSQPQEIRNSQVPFYENQTESTETWVQNYNNEYNIQEQDINEAVCRSRNHTGNSGNLSHESSSTKPSHAGKSKLKLGSQKFDNQTVIQTAVDCLMDDDSEREECTGSNFQFQKQKDKWKNPNEPKNEHRHYSYGGQAKQMRRSTGGFNTHHQSMNAKSKNYLDEWKVVGETSRTPAFRYQEEANEKDEIQELTSKFPGENFFLIQNSSSSNKMDIKQDPLEKPALPEIDDDEDYVEEGENKDDPFFCGFKVVDILEEKDLKRKETKSNKI